MKPAHPHGRAPRRRRRTFRGGFLLPDILIGLSVVGICIAVLAAASGRLRQVDRDLAEVRQTVRDLERVAVELDTRGPGVSATEVLPRGVSLRWLGTPAPDGLAWARLSVVHDSGRKRLVTLTRVDAGETP